MDHLPSEIDPGETDSIEEYEVREGWERTFINAVDNVKDMLPLLEHNMDKVVYLHGENLFDVINTVPSMAVEIWRHVDDYEFEHYAGMLSSEALTTFIEDGYAGEILPLLLPDGEHHEGEWSYLFKHFDEEDMWTLIGDKSPEYVDDIIMDRDNAANAFTEIPEYPIFKFLENGGRPEKIMATRNPYAIRQ
jgi:hypothetical protein